MPASPSGSESSGRLSSPLDTSSGVLPHSNVLHHSRLSMPSPLPLDARIGNSSGGNQNNNNSPNNTNNNAPNSTNTSNNTADSSSGGGGGSTGGGQMNLGRKDYGSLDKYDYDKLGHLNENNNITSLLSGMRGLDHHAQHGASHHPNNSDSGKSYHAAMKMAAMLGQGHISAHGHGNMMHHQGGPGQIHSSQDMMATHRLQAELIRSQAEALRLAVANSNGLNNSNIGNNNSNGNNPMGSSSTGNNLVETLGNQLSLNLVAQQQHQHQQHQHQQHLQQHNGHNSHGMHHPQSLNQQQLNSILSQNSDLSEALLRLDARTLGFPLPAHNS